MTLMSTACPTLHSSLNSSMAHRHLVPLSAPLDASRSSCSGISHSSMQPLVPWARQHQVRLWVGWRTYCRPCSTAACRTRRRLGESRHRSSRRRRGLQAPEQAPLPVLTRALDRHTGLPYRCSSDLACRRPYRTMQGNSWEMSSRTLNTDSPEGRRGMSRSRRRACKGWDTSSRSHRGQTA
jgi:hypothetical protein